jgi:hypothetical protein
MKRLLQKITNWELWPFWLRYAPIAPVWLWYCLRSRSLWIFSSSNPTITFGGFEGEGKKEMYDQLIPSSRPLTTYVNPHDDFEKVKQIIAEDGFTYPFCVKPDVGMKGLMFRKIDNEQQLKKYHQQVSFEYIIQELITLPIEASVFYYRFPDQERGVITGFILKQLLEVKGDGKSTLRQLIEHHPTAQHRIEEMYIKHAPKLNAVIPDGESYLLAYAANLNRGATFINLQQEIDEKLHKAFDVISHRTNFYYGRYDLKCSSIEELKKGNFKTLEFNGCGAEPNHVYQCGYSLLKAYKEILKHWNVLYKISRINKQRGVDYWEFKKGLHFLKNARQHFNQLEELDKKIFV